MAALTPLLETVGLTKRFDGLAAVQGVDFSLTPGEIRALIGPNGAGKTTLLGLICGRLAPTAGRIRFRGRDITDLEAHARVALGIAYTFQVTSVFRTMTVFDNVVLAAQRRWARGWRAALAADGRAVREEAARVLEGVGLTAGWDRPAGALPYGHQRLLEVAMALAADPILLALDEPTQGLAEEEIALLTDLLRRLAGRLTILLVEHNMAVVLELARRVTVMHEGRILAEGSPPEIETNPEVQRVYLGAA